LLRLGVVAAARPIVGAAAAPDRARTELKLGVATYSLREIPLDAAVRMIARVGVRYASIKDVHMPRTSSAAERRAVAEKFRAAGITPLSCGNVKMTDSEADIRSAFEYARDAGLGTMVCSPDPRSMALLDRMVKRYDIRLAIHNHGPEDGRFPSPLDVWRAVEPYDRRIGLCIDVGHTLRAGVDPAAAIRSCASRLYDLHLKDLAHRGPKAVNVEVGRGVLDIRSILGALVEIGYRDQVALEYEKDPGDPLAGIAESIGFVRGVLSGLGGGVRA
jgi:sugar phosphate isomerase/epimerase